MKLRYSAPLLLALLAGCSDSNGPTSPAAEASVFNLLGGLEVGQALTLTGENAQTFYLRGGADGAEYVYVPFFASASGTATLNVEITGAGVGPVVGPPNPSLGETGDLRPSGGAGLDPSGADAFDLRLRQMERRVLTPKLAAARGVHANRALGPSFQTAQNVPQVGDIVQLNAQANDPCENPDYRNARVVAVSDKAVVVADTRNPTGGFTDDEYRAIAEQFDALVYPVDTRNFGEPTDLDNNGRVLLFFTSAVNDLTPEDANFVIGGFFFARDLFPRTAANPDEACPGSNDAELFYLLVPDPAGSINGNVRDKEDVVSGTTAIVGHEFQHLINASRRIYVNDATSFEEAWLNEGLSHIAEELLFYAVSGLEPRQNITLEKLRANPQGIDAVNTYQIQNLIRYFIYLTNPEAESLLGIDNLSTRGATWSFLRYAADHEDGADQDFFFRLVNSERTGVANLTQVLGTDAKDVMQRWTVSVYTDDAGIPNLAEQFVQPSWNFRDLLAALATNGNFPLAVLRPGAGQQTTISLLGGGAAFVRFGVAGGATAKITATSGGVTPPNGLRVSVVRTK